jgi:hypothetical protein
MTEEESGLRDLLEQFELSTWIDTFGTVFSQEKSERTKFALWPQQRKLCENINRWQNQGFNETALPKARQNGASELAGERALKDLMTYPKNKILCISGNLPKAEEFLKERVLEKYYALPKGKIPWPTITRITTTYVQFSNGAEFRSLPASDTAGQSYSASAVILDECGAIDLNNNASFEGVYRNVQPAIEKAGKRGWLMQIGTSEAGTAWNDKIKKIMDGKDKITKMHFIGWRADPSRDEGWYEKTKQKFPNEVDFKTQYPETIKDFFVVKEGLAVPQFEEDIHVREFEIPEYYTKLYFGYDHGYIHPAVFLTAIYEYKKDILYIYDEDYWTQMETSQIASKIKTKVQNTEALLRLRTHKNIADSAIWQRKEKVTVADEFRKGGVRFSKAYKHGGLTGPDGSLEKMRRYFHRRKIIIHPRCQRLIQDLNSWRYKKGLSETLEDKNDDGCDVLRYLIQDVKEIKGTAEEAFHDRTGYQLGGKKGYGSAFSEGNDVDRDSWMAY